jgi:hypothetical protein
MIKLCGIIKFIFSFYILFVCFIYYLNFDNEFRHWAYPIIAITVIVAVYEYYLITTGLWNLDRMPYKINILLVAGLSIHFSFIIFETNYVWKSYVNNGLFHTPFLLLGLIIGLYDFIQFYKSWKNKRIKTI